MPVVLHGAIHGIARTGREKGCNFARINVQMGQGRVAKKPQYAGITREEGLQNGQSVRKVSCQHVLHNVP